MLERVPLLEKHLDDYAGVVERRGRSNASASSPRRSQGARVLHVERDRVRRRRRRAARHPRAAAARLGHRGRVAGDPRQRRVLRASPRPCTTRCRAPTSSGPRRCSAIYLEKVLDNALLLEGEWDFVVIHDPQPAAMLELRARVTRRRPAPSTKWIWRCHIDLTDANPDGVGVLPAVRRAVRRVGVDDAAVRARVARRWTASCTRRRASTRSR